MAAAREPLAPLAATDSGVDPDCPGGGWGPPPELPIEGEVFEPMSIGQLLGAIGTLMLSLPAIIGAWCWPMVVAAIFNVGASVMNGGSGTGIVSFFHGLQVAIMMMLMFNLVQFIWWTCKSKRTGTFWEVHQPTMLVLLSAILTNIQPMMILAIGSWELCCGPCYNFPQPGITPPTNWPAGPNTCSPSGLTYPPWSSGEARPCGSSPSTWSKAQLDKTTLDGLDGGNIFWDITYCAGGNYALFPTQWQGWCVQIFCTWGGFVFMFIGVFQATALHVKFAAKWRAIRRGNAAPQPSTR